MPLTPPYLFALWMIAVDNVIEMKKITKNIAKAIVFDFDDTLVGTHQAIWDLHRYIAKTYYDVELDDELIRKYWGRPITELARVFYKTNDIELAIQRMVDHQFDFPKLPFVATNPTIKKLRSDGKLVGMVSAITLPILVKDAEIIDLDLKDFDYIQTAENTQVHKPDPNVFIPMKEWMLEHDIQPEEIVYVGDGIQDVEAAQGAGLSFIGITTGLVSAEVFAEYGVETIKSLDELQKLI